MADLQLPPLKSYSVKIAKMQQVFIFLVLCVTKSVTHRTSDIHTEASILILHLAMSGRVHACVQLLFFMHARAHSDGNSRLPTAGRSHATRHRSGPHRGRGPVTRATRHGSRQGAAIGKDTHPGVRF